MSGLRSRRKGARGQCEVVNILKAAGIETINIGLMYQKGPDLAVKQFDRPSEEFTHRTAEVKRRSSSYGTTYKHLGENWALFVRDDGKPWLIVQTLDQWLKDRA